MRGRHGQVGRARPCVGRQADDPGVVLWNPVDLSYAATNVMRALANGKPEPGATCKS